MKHLLAALLLAGCASTMAPPTEGSWALESIDGASVAADAHPTLSFADGRVSGNGGCNSFSGPYRQAGADIVFSGPIISTMMACHSESGPPNARMEQEHLFLSALEGTVDVAQPDADTLVLTGAQGRVLRFRRAAQ